MKINTLGTNQTEVYNNDKIVFFSYNTPVACNFDGQFFKTEKFWSNTTLRHISKWLDGARATIKPQSFFDELV